MDTININSSTELYCIFGKPVAHSLSPVMHNAAFRETGLNAVYLAFEPPSAGEAIRAMRALGIRGASVTIPYKIDVISLADEVDPLASDIGSVNTLLNRNGVIAGFNTDGYGAVRALEEAHVRIGESTCLIIGNGGSARAIAATLHSRGALIIIAGRNMARVHALAADMCGSHPARAVPLDAIDRALMDSVDIVINTTPLGMPPYDDSSPIADSLLSPHHAVFDIVYAPHTTRLLAAAGKTGCTIVHGIEMLIHQGARQFEIWTGTPAPVGAMRRAITSHLGFKPDAR